MSTATATPIHMPRLSDSMEEGTIVSWLVADGDVVEVGREIAEIETDKATMPYEAETAGVIRLYAAEGDAVAVGTMIATIGPAEAQPPPDDTTAGGDAASRRMATGRTGTTAQSGELSARKARANASPLARRLAADLGVDLGSVTGTGPAGRIVKADIERADNAAARHAQRPPATSDPAKTVDMPAEPAGAETASSMAQARSDRNVTNGSGKGDVEVRDLSRLQSVVARRMAQSKATAPDFVLTTHVDMEAAVTLREQLREMLGAEQKPPSFNDFVVKACGLALRDAPLANGSYIDGRFELHSRINIGIAVAARDTLVVPTIFDADQKSLGEIARTARRLAERVREATITPPELSGGTFSISNLGMYGIDEFTAVLNPPQAAILAVGRLAPRAAVRDGTLVARHMMTLTMSCDHRILYGANAAELLSRIRALLESPGALVL
ncbi:MAG: dihydrolipoamide acetyltransferase family protein [Solirubrobacteraceae bacterium]